MYLRGCEIINWRRRKKHEVLVDECVLSDLFFKLLFDFDFW